MSAVREVLVPLGGVDLRLSTTLRVSLLPATTGFDGCEPLLDFRGSAGGDNSLEPIQLLESVEYRYLLTGDEGGGIVSTDRPEIFAADDNTGRSGRLRPGLHTGMLRIKFRTEREELGEVCFEVRSRKLNYLTDYRTMLSDVAETATEAVMERFAVSGQSFSSASRGDALTLYQRFAFLQSLFANDTFQAAMRQVLGRTYVTWKTNDEVRPAGRGVRTSSRISRQIAAHGPRVEWPANPFGVTLPATFRDSTTESTLDNVPNRFVKFALQRWRESTLLLSDAMRGLPDSESKTRGVRESLALLEQLDAVLEEELFREVGDLVLFPSSNQVLQKRAGYRDVFRAYLQFEVAAQLAWQGGEDVFQAGQRDVATLYEYWTYLQLAKLLSGLCGVPFDFCGLLHVGREGLSLDLQKGKHQVLAGSATRLGRKLEIQLWYNRRFRRTKAPAEGSWTIGMQPDFSVRMSPAAGSMEYCEPVWVHFDAKYRVSRLRELFGDEPQERSDSEHAIATEGGSGFRLDVKSDDLIKMHAYRDAIRLSAGAYVLYPGDVGAPRNRYSEILPGLGAFVLRPGSGSEPEGTGELRRFLEDVLVHVAHQASQHERARFWTGRIYGEPTVPPATNSQPFLSEPPGDTPILIGFVKDQAHLAWVHRTGLYNLRADGRAGSVSREFLHAEFLLIWGDGLGDRLELWRVGQVVEQLTAEDLRDSEYPEPRGTRYYGLRLQSMVVETEYPGVTREKVATLLRSRSPHEAFGTPARVVWSDLLRIEQMG